MEERFMLLPGSGPEDTHLLRIPDDYSDLDAYRHVTAIIAQCQEAAGETRSPHPCLETLAEEGFSEVRVVIGPRLG